MNEGLWIWSLMLLSVAALSLVGYYFFGDENGKTVFEITIPKSRKRSFVKLQKYRLESGSSNQQSEQ